MAIIGVKTLRRSLRGLLYYDTDTVFLNSQRETDRRSEQADRHSWLRLTSDRGANRQTVSPQGQGIIVVDADRSASARLTKFLLLLFVIALTSCVRFNTFKMTDSAADNRSRKSSSSETPRWSEIVKRVENHGVSVDRLNAIFVLFFLFPRFFSTLWIRWKNSLPNIWDNRKSIVWESKLCR